QSGKSHLVGIPACEACERGVGARWLEEVEQGGGADKLAIQRGETGEGRTIDENPQRHRRNHVNAAGARCSTSTAKRCDRAERLLMRQVSDAGDARSVQDSLKDGCTVGSRWIGGHKSPSGRATEDQEL